MGVLVICSYRPKAGQDAALDRLIEDHVPLLRRHGLVTERPAIKGKAADGTRIEVFEWQSEEKSRSAHAIPEIGTMWESMAAVADFVPLSAVPETARPFAHFLPL